MDGWTSVVAGVAMVVGTLVFSYGMSVVSMTLLGGVHIAAIGLSLVLSGVFVTTYARTRLGLSVGMQRRLVFGFVALAGLLILVFLLVNGAVFGSFESSSGSSGGA